MDELTHTFEPGDLVYSDPEGFGLIVRKTPAEYTAGWRGKGPYWTVWYFERRKPVNDPKGWIVSGAFLDKIPNIGELLVMAGQGMIGLLQNAKRQAGV